MKFTAEEIVEAAEELAKKFELDKPMRGLVEEAVAEAKNKIAKNILNLIEIMGQNGNWNYDEYQFGLANGLVVAYAVITGKEPMFFHKPPVWLKDIEEVSPPEHPDSFFFKEAMKVLEEQ